MSLVLIVAFVVFLVIRQMNRMMPPPQTAPAEPPKTCPFCASPIRMPISQPGFCSSSDSESATKMRLLSSKKIPLGRPNEPDDIETLLPWHAAGTLSPREARRVEDALAVFRREELVGGPVVPFGEFTIGGDLAGEEATL